jgi:hypothetical protein
MKIKSKANIKPAVAHAVGTRSASIAPRSLKIKSKSNIKPTLAHAEENPKRRQTQTKRPDMPKPPDILAFQ